MTPSIVPVFRKHFSMALSLAVLAPLVTACSGSEASPGEAFSATPWVLEGPEARIGSVDDPDFAFPRVMSLATGPDGHLYTTHFQETRVRRWTRDGMPAGTIGREGEGPGEFSRPSLLGFFGDTLWVMDSRLYRVTYFTPDGTVLGTVSPSWQTGGGEGSDRWASPPRPSRPLRDGTFLSVAPAWSDAIARGNLSSVPYVNTDADGEALSTIWHQPYRSTDVLALLRKDGGTFSSQPFGDQPLTEVTDEGSFWVVDRRAYEGEGDATFSLTRIDTSGDTLLRREFPYDPQSLPVERVDSAAQSIAERLHGFMSRNQPDLSLASLRSDLVDAIYAPGYLPPLEDLKIASDGSIWLQRFVPTADGSAEWWILHPDGEPAGRAFTPAGLRVLHIDGDDVWGVESDEMDVDYIVRYRVDRG